MNITLNTVRDVIRAPFGKDSFVASFITSVEASDSCPTAYINAEGELQYNSEFAAQYLTTPASLFCLIVHELCHCMFRHSVHGAGPLENLGEDALINAFITQAFPDSSDHGRLFREFYAAEGVTGLLRPSGELRLSRFGPLYDQLYCVTREVSSGEVIRALRILIPDEESVCSITLIGSHGAQQQNLARDTAEGLAEDFAQVLDKTNAVGKGGNLVNLFRKRIASAVTIRRAVLRRYTTSRRLDRFVEPLREHRTGVSPVPIAPTKRELIMLHAGVMPPHFHRLMVTNKECRKGLAVYLDVSGSVQEHLPRILGVLARLKDVLTSVFLFSTEVREVTFRELSVGKIATTYGTSFDCVALSILDKGFERAIIVTDGYAFLTDSTKDELLEARTKLLTILFGGSSDCPPLAPFGEVVQLDDVVG